MHMHTHYSPYGPPRQVEGTLLSCDDVQAHSIEHSEISADYMYSPQFGKRSATGLPEGELVRLLIAYGDRRSADTQFRIADVVADEEFTYRVRITNRTAYASDEPGPMWHTEEWGLYPDGVWRSTKNPHPGYEHWSAWCPNCGY